MPGIESPHIILSGQHLRVSSGTHDILTMAHTMDRRDFMKLMAAGALLSLPASAQNPSQLESLVDQNVDPQHAPIIKGLIERESAWDPNAYRYEPHINDASYGLMQVLTKTAEMQKNKHNQLPFLNSKRDLYDPATNIQYGYSLFKDGFDRYGSVALALAAYNAGLAAPQLAADQHNLNQVLNTQLVPDGAIGQNSEQVVLQFQQHWNATHPKDSISADGKMGPETRSCLIREMKTNQLVPVEGLVPKNGHTPNYVRDVLNESKKYA